MGTSKKISAYYNDHDDFCCGWISNLMDYGLITPGTIDNRKVEDVDPSTIVGYSRYHFFAGIAGWEYALNLAGWGSRPVMTASLPCQPFSVAGKQKGFSDERHIWPSFRQIIAILKPTTIFGEQVPAAIKLGWLDRVFDDLEGRGYACGAVVLPACSVGAPHIRQRLWWVADAKNGDGGSRVRGTETGIGADEKRRRGSASGRPDGGVADTGHQGLEGRDINTSEQSGLQSNVLGPDGFDVWQNSTPIPCADGKWRRVPVEPLLFPLSPGVPESMDALRSIETSAWEEIIDYGASNKTRPGEVLRMVRETHEKEKVQRSIARQIGIYSTEILFNFLLYIETTFDSTADETSREEKGAEIQYRVLRIMRTQDGNSCPSCQWEPEGQLTEEPTNALFILSLILARHAQAFGVAIAQAHASTCRVGALRGAGNAIVPQVAAEFIKAFMEAEK